MMWGEWKQWNELSGEPFKTQGRVEMLGGEPVEEEKEKKSHYITVKGREETQGWITQNLL